MGRADSAQGSIHFDQSDKILRTTHRNSPALCGMKKRGGHENKAEELKQGRNTDAGADAEVVEECCLLDFFP